MSTSFLVFGACAALSVFWAVGAHNRLVRLSHAVVAAHAPVDTYLRARQLMLGNWLGDAARGGLAPADRSALGQALQAVDKALDDARRHSLSPVELSRLNQAEQAQNEALTRLWFRAAGSHEEVDARRQDLRQALFEANEQIALAAVPYLAAVRAYNQAVTEFPAVLVARLSRLRALPEFCMLDAAASPWALADMRRG
ncbi:MAG: LemA family protein [Betaproteobacteria bacterium]|nr:LemA family protein [Betaproteobacteria bacterium]